MFYLGGSRVLKSSKRGEDLYPISPDLSVKTDPAQERARLARIDTVEKYTGGITLDLTGAETYGTVVALQESPIKPGLLLAGTDNGNVWMTHNDGATWENLTPKFAALGVPKDAYVVRLEPTHFDTLTFYVAFENHRWNDFTPYLFVTNDGGKTFRSIVNNLPKTSPADYLHVIREDPHNRDLLFVGSSRSVYASIDRGTDVDQVRDEFPDGAGVRSADSSARSRADRGDARPQPLDRGHRGARADDAEGLLAQGTYLFQPKTAFQWGEGPQPGLPGNGYGQAVMTYANPPYGADIVYRLACGVRGRCALDRERCGRRHARQPDWPGRRRRASRDLEFPAGRRRVVRQPSCRRRSDATAFCCARARRQVLDSLTKAGYDTAAIRTVRAQVAQMVESDAAAGGWTRRSRRWWRRRWWSWRRRRSGVRASDDAVGDVLRASGGSRRADVAAVAALADSAPTQRRRRRACRRAAGGGRGGRGGRGGGRGGRGAQGATGDAALDPIGRIWSLIGMNPPAPAGGRGGGGGGGGGGSAARRRRTPATISSR